jgi:ATP:corrinoid adenosyltransferase
MIDLTREFIRDHVADSVVIFQRGVQIYQHGSFLLLDGSPQKGFFTYEMDGNYGDYETRIVMPDGQVETSCDCPYPGKGCKHTVAALLDARDVLEQWRSIGVGSVDQSTDEPYLTPDEIKQLALEDREKRARNEAFTVTEGDMPKGEHLVQTVSGRIYTVTLHDPANGMGHCTCPDYLTNRLGTCKHIIFLTKRFAKKRGAKERLARERFPFVDLFWDSVTQRPKMFSALTQRALGKISRKFSTCFDADGTFCCEQLSDILPLLDQIRSNKRVRVQEALLERLDRFLQNRQMVELAQQLPDPVLQLKTQLYPYQNEGVQFGLYKRAALIGDEMGLGKTLQAIGLAVLKKEIFGFSKVLVITLASLKEQWAREIERFTHESSTVVAGNPQQRQAIYWRDESFFKITNYEAVLRDVTTIARYKPDLVILDEAQRIKNFSTKTADAVKQLPRKHALVLTGTPLENKLEDVYSIVQFLDPDLLSPLWRFAADHFMISRKKKGKIIGYRNLDRLHTRLKSIVIRRRKEEVLSDLPEEVVNNYYLPLHEKQAKIHNGYMQSLLPLINKKYLTPMDLRRIQELLLRMRMVCNSTYLIDRKTNISPKLAELEGVIDELVVQNGRKMIIFSEWTTMTFLIARHLSDAGIGFVELSGKVPVKKRQALIDEFTQNPDCRVFLSTDAGGTGLNLQAADCVVNFELPWNPARMNQRIGRVNRIGQTSKCVNVINLITIGSIEEKILAGLQLKTDLFEGVFDGTTDMVEFSREKRTEMLNQLREMMGEEPVPVVTEAAPSPDIPEDTPYYFNPKALNQAETVDVAAEEQLEAGCETGGVENGETTNMGQGVSAATVAAQQAPEQIESVLNSGMQFIGGLLEMATGQKITANSDDGRMLSIDKESGEVTLKFKLPGF